MPGVTRQKELRPISFHNRLAQGLIQRDNLYPLMLIENQCTSMAARVFKGLFVYSAQLEAADVPRHLSYHNNYVLTSQE